jgi:hypothetical protein
MAEPTFLVDKKGLAKILGRRGKEFIITELLQNAWDEKGVTEVRVDFEQANGRAVLSVLDDAPEGFADLTHAYTLFAESKKKDNPEQRGRFNLGEKLVIAICDRVQVATTKGTIVFDEAGRTHNKERTQRGSVLRCELRMNKDEAADLENLAMDCIPPENIATFFNGHKIQPRPRLRTITATLPTEKADAEGYLKPTARQTELRLYTPLPGEVALLYEMGIPVVETGDTYHVDVQQKVPLNSDRDNVTPSYLQKVRVAVLNATAETLTPENATSTWVAAALEDKNANVEATQAIVKARFGDKVVISDPSDPEGTKMAMAQGYTVLAPRTFSHDAWQNVKAAGIKPAGQVTPSPKPYGTDGVPVNDIPEAEWTQDMRDTVGYMQSIGQTLLDYRPAVQIINNATANFTATFGPGGPLTLNYGRLGKAWFARKEWMDYAPLALHEFAHQYESDHLSHRFADTVARLGAKLAKSMIAR